MKQWMAKLGQGMARLAPWRKRAGLADQARTEPVVAADTQTPPAPDSRPTPAADSSPSAAAIPVAAVAGSLQPRSTIDDDALTDSLAELGDPVGLAEIGDAVGLAEIGGPGVAPIDSIDVLFADGLAELDDLSMSMQNETITSEALYTPQPTDDQNEFDALSDPRPVEPDQAPAAAAVPDLSDTSAVIAAAAAATAPPPGRNEATPADPAATDTHPVGRLRRLIGGVRLFATRIRQATLTALSLKGLSQKGGARHLMGIVGKKRVWIPAVSLTLLGIVGSLAFMLVQSSNEKSQLQADLNAAKQALKQAAPKPSVAIIPPLLTAPAMPPAVAHPAPLPAPVPTQTAATPPPA
ncbi:MAG: hypothetical protein IV085_09095, partial [Thiobacillus sp.]|nr:hypothetical protein [Thiobacillus sp.]